MSRKEKPSLPEYFESRWRQKHTRKSPSEIRKHICYIIERLAFYLDHLSTYERESITQKIRRYFSHSDLIECFLNRKDPKGLIKQGALKEYRLTGKSRTLSDFYALYAGFAGESGYDDSVTIKDCFNLEYNFEKLDDHAIVKYLEPERLSKKGNKIQILTIEDEFLEAYVGNYNVFFIEESIDENIRFGVSNLVLNYYNFNLYFKQIDGHEIAKSSFMVSDELSTESTFYFRETHSKWGYMGSVARLSPVEKNESNDFLLPHLGVMKSSGYPMSCMAYVQRIEKSDDFILARRNFLEDEIELLKSTEDPISTVEFNRSQKRRYTAEQTYDQREDEGKSLDNGTVEKLKNIIETLKEIGKPLEYRKL